MTARVASAVCAGQHSLRLWTLSSTFTRGEGHRLNERFALKMIKTSLFLCRHGILGGSRHIMLDADRLLKGGYLSIPIDNVETHITEAGRGTYDDSLLEEEEDEGVEVEGATGVTDIRPNLVSHLVQQTAEISA